jgi:uncharacterized membrane protein
VFLVGKKAGREISGVLIPIIYGLLAIAIMMLVCWSGQYPFGSETMTHIYRGNLVYQALCDGKLFPMYDPAWYNGVEVSGYCAPVPAYILALCQAVAGGDALDGYLLFTGFVFFTGAMAWLFVGKRKKRLLLGAVLGGLWFFMPNNLFVLFFEGNLARALCMVILPVFLSYAYDYVLEGKWKYLLRIIISYAVIALCDVDYAIMTAIAFAVFAVVYGILCHQWRKSLRVLLAMLLAILAAGIWTVPYMIANAGTDNSEIMQNYFQSIVKTLNPWERISSANKYYYFGLASFLLLLFGMAGARKKSMAGFGTAGVLLLGTVSSLYFVLRLMPGRNYLLICQYISLALCFVLYAFVLWDSLKKPLTVAFCILIALDTIPSLDLIYGTLSGVPLEERFDEQDETTLIKRAKEVCQQRIALMDESVLESMGTYLVSAYGDGKAETFGGDWASAETATNIMQLNRALTGGFYPYLFDRCMELGNDTVLIKLSQIDSYEAPVTMLDEAAAAVGYELVDSNEFYRLYDMDIEGSWGTKAKYPAIGIGTGASVISLCFPAVQEVTSTSLNDYTFEELSQYQLIYLAGFTYTDKESAEDLVVRLSEAGVRIVILADGIPEDSLSHTQDFLGVVCNDITFSNGYPLLDTKIGVLDCDFFPQGYEEWNTVYVNGLDETWGTVREENMDLDFYGTVKNDNIIVVGLNLTYYYSVSKDSGVGELLSDITKLNAQILPDRTIVPLTIEYGADSLTITSPEDQVNTSLAYHDMFSSRQSIEKENNLLYVDSGTTSISMEYSYFYWGIGVSLLGITFTIIFLNVLRPDRRKQLNKTAE